MSKAAFTQAFIAAGVFFIIQPMLSRWTNGIVPAS